MGPEPGVCVLELPVGCNRSRVPQQSVELDGVGLSQAGGLREVFVVDAWGRDGRDGDSGETSRQGVSE